MKSNKKGVKLTLRMISSSRGKNLSRKSLGAVFLLMTRKVVRQDQLIVRQPLIAMCLLVLSPAFCHVQCLTLLYVPSPSSAPEHVSLQLNYHHFSRYNRTKTISDKSLDQFSEQLKVSRFQQFSRISENFLKSSLPSVKPCFARTASSF